MGRRELRESIFQLLFMTEFNDNQEMAEQKQLYLEGIEDIQDKDQSYIQDKFEKIREKLPEIDEALNEASKGWKTSRMGKVELSILRLAVYESSDQRSRRTGKEIRRKRSTGIYQRCTGKTGERSR